MLRVSRTIGESGFGCRREFLRVGAAGLLGLGLPELLRAQGALDTQRAKPRIRSVILFFLEGGPAHQDLWDMKPDAPDGVRGEFQPIATTVPGLSFCEHLPRLAKLAHHFTVIRSMHHSISDHNAGAYQTLTGADPVRSGSLITAPSPDNHPPFGSVLAKLEPSGRPLPDFVQTPDWMSNNGAFLPGQTSGFLGSDFDPFLTGDPSLPGYSVPGLGLPIEVSLDRLHNRRALLTEIDQVFESSSMPRLQGRDVNLDKAFTLIESRQARRAFDLLEEPRSVRERYGLDPTNDRKREARQFGGLPQLGQSLLLTRRLVEAGVKLVTVCTGARFDQTWDTHRNHFPLLKRSILPTFDQGFSALIEDLHTRGLLEETLVVAMGEFGRTPRLGQVTSSAGVDKGGRDHWPYCYTVLLAGGGMPGGAIHGASDKNAAYPAKDPVTPADIAATIYQRLGIAPGSMIQDQLQRPHILCQGEPIKSLL